MSPLPVRGTTAMAARSIVAEMQRQLGALVETAIADGEAPIGARLDVQRMVWVLPASADAGD